MQNGINYYTEILPDEFYKEVELVLIYSLRLPMLMANDFSKLINNDNFCSKFPHLKRMRKILDPNNTENLNSLSKSENILVEVLIGELPEIPLESEKFLKERNVELVWNKLHLPRYPPLTREKHEELASLWPLTFLKPKWNCESFSKEQQLEINRLIELAVKIGQSASLKGNPNRGCVIVLRNKIAAIGEDSRVSSYPWMHSVMSAVSNFSSLLKSRHKKGIERIAVLDEESCDVDSEHISKDEMISNSELEGQYLCTNCTVYLSHEPCISCSMALVHSRVSKVFYLHEDPRKGFLGSNHKLHCIPELNHHYKVFRAIHDGEINGGKLL